MMNNRELVVKGIGNAAVAPDLIVLNMNLEVLEQDYEKTMQRSAEILDTLREAVVSAGHDGNELKSTSFNINTKYESYKEKETWNKAQYIVNAVLHYEDCGERYGKKNRVYIALPFSPNDWNHDIVFFDVSHALNAVPGHREQVVDRHQYQLWLELFYTRISNNNR